MAKVSKVKKAERVPRSRDRETVPFVAKLVEWEFEHSGSNSIVALAAVWDANDIQHSAGIITDDAWNGKKGWFQTIATADVFAQIGLPVLKTLVEAAKPAIGQLSGRLGPSQFAQMSKEEQQQAVAALAAVESANADSALEG